jgi:hypothetical protein
MIKKFILSVFILLLCFTQNAQSLYWVAGSGNFNDGNHWSLVSGGVPSGQIPNVNSDLIFD